MSVPSPPVTTRSPSPLAAVPGAAEQAEISFVIVTYGTGPVVVEAITALVASMDSRPFEVIVVDNEYPDHPTGTRNELALSTAGVRLIRPGRNLGFAGGCELGALHAGGSVLAFVNPDLVPQPGWIEPLLAVLDTGVSIVAPVLLEPDGSVQEAGAVLYADGSTGPITDPNQVTSGNVVPDYASAACWLMTRDEHERLGGFDPAFHPAFYEDVEFAMRARRLSGRLQVVTGVGVVHLRGQGTGGGSRRADTSAQRDLLLGGQPAIRWTQPPRPDRLW